MLFSPHRSRMHTHLSEQTSSTADVQDFQPCQRFSRMTPGVHVQQIIPGQAGLISNQSFPQTKLSPFLLSLPTRFMLQTQDECNFGKMCKVRCYGRTGAEWVSVFCLRLPLSQLLNHQPLNQPQISSGYNRVHETFLPSFLILSHTDECQPDALNMQNRQRFWSDSSSLKFCWGAGAFVQTVEEKKIRRWQTST